MTNVQKEDWFLRLNPNGRIPVIIDNTQNPPFPVMETSAELLYLLKFADKNDVFGFKDELERNQALQWLFFWHGSGGNHDTSPYWDFPRTNSYQHHTKAKPTTLANSQKKRSLVCISPHPSKLHRDQHLTNHPYQTPSTASTTKPSASTASSRSNSAANIPAPHAIT